MDELLALLEGTELFAAVPADVIRQQLIPRGWLQEYQKGQLLVLPQQRVDQLGILVTGRLHVLHIFPDGGESLMNDILPGEYLGIDLICTRSRLSPYHAVAAAASQVFYLPITVLETLEPGLQLRLLRRMLYLISQDNMKKEYRLAILSQKGLRERIVTYLTMQANRRRRETFAISYSREELASYLCVNRSALSHELSLMEKEGLISFRKNVFTLHNWELDF